MAKRCAWTRWQPGRASARVRPLAPVLSAGYAIRRPLFTALFSAARVQSPSGFPADDVEITCVRTRRGRELRGSVFTGGRRNVRHLERLENGKRTSLSAAAPERGPEARTEG